MGRMLSWFHPNYNAAAALSLKNLLTPVKRIYLLLFQYSAQRWFSKMLAQETFQPMSFSFLEQSIIYSSSSMPFLVIKKSPHNPGAIFIAIPPNLMIPLHVPCIKIIISKSLTPIQRIYLLLFQYSARRWFSKMLAQETFQPMGFLFLEQSIIYSSSSMP